MKRYNKLFIGASLCFAVCSCADQGLLPFPGELQVPDEILQNKNLQEYDVLKNYVNRTENPGFKLGCAVDESDFIGKGTTLGIAKTNFEDVTPGNAMKYSSVVDDDGNMDFSTVLSFIETAQEAGLSIYGHTLCWHSQQNVNYLNGLIAPTIIPGEGGNGGYCLVLMNSAAGSNVWDSQTWYQLSNFLEEGEQYTISFMAKADEAYNLQLYLQSSTGGDQGYPGGVNVDTEWTNLSLSFTPAHGAIDKIAFNFGTYVGNIYIDDVKITKSGSSDNLIANGDFEEVNINGWTGWTPGKFEKISEDGQGYSTGGGESTLGYCMILSNSSAGANVWDSQTWYQLSDFLESGAQYTYSFMAKADEAYSLEIYLQSSTGGSQGYPGSVSIDKEWKEVSLSISPSHDAIDKIAFNFGTYVGNIYIDNVKLTKSGSSDNLILNGDFEEANISGWTGWTPGKFEKISEDGQGYTTGGGDQIIEKTDEEKHDIIYAALDTWIKNMMENCAGNVKVWDVVNEPMSDGNPNELKHYDTESADTRDNCFYWQDYLGDNYARDAVALARKYFEEFGGNPSDLKLFVNDYNLEASYNKNAKCEGLIKMIQQWESDGVTKIDGIGTQMHVSCSLNPETQQKNEDAVVNMFNLLAQTGKQIKISELDMGLTDENGDNVLTTDVTYVQLLHMADYYNFIVRKYFELIPQNQRYGITQWSQTDAGDEDYAWRKGMPIGLWTRSYDRKPAYAGFADGLAGTEKSYLEWATEDGTDNGNENTDVVE